MNRFLYVIALGLGTFFIFVGCSGGGSSSSTPTCSVGGSASNCNCPSGTSSIGGICQSTGYGGAYGNQYGGGYGGCQPCSNPYNGSQGIQTQMGCATPIQQANGQCTGILPNGQVVQGIPMQGYSGYPGQGGYPYGGGYGGGGYIPPIYGGGYQGGYGGGYNGGGYYPYWYARRR